MEDDPYKNPWLGQFLPPKPAPAVTPAAIAEYLKKFGTADSTADSVRADCRTIRS